MTNTLPSPIRVTAQYAHPVCLACSKGDRTTVFTTDPETHVAECHPESVNAVRAQFAPVHHKIVRTAR